jgi:hypothetical protein
MHRLGLLVLLVACGGGGGGPQDTADASVDARSMRDPALDGTWEARICTSQARMTLTATFTGDQYVWRTGYFRDTDTTCAAPFKIVNTNGPYVAGDDALISVGAREIDFETAATTLVPADAQAASFWNQIAFCGYSNWAVGVARDVTGKTCDDGSGMPDVYFPAGQTSYDIYRVFDGTELRFGSSSSGSRTSDATRPTALANTPYTRR